MIDRSTESEPNFDSLINCIIKMDQRNSNLPTRPIVSHPLPPPTPPPNDTHEEPKLYRDSKFFLVPKHTSYPPSLQQSAHDGQGRKFAPFFDPFHLSNLYGKKEMTEEQVASFTKEDEALKAQALQQENGQGAQQMGSFTFINKSLGSATPNRLERGPDGRRARPKEKGLRKLSQRAYEIVLNLRSASYKEVANKLVDELNNEQELDNGVNCMLMQEKDEQNIKRRVYDALNVLIALGVLRKDGRRIVGDRDNQLNFQQGVAKKLRKEVSRKEEIMKKKIQKINDLQRKKLICSELILENRQKIDQDQKIHIPFLVLQNQHPGTVRDAKDRGDCTKFKMSWPKNSSDSGHFDLDFLVEYNKVLEKLRQ